MNLHHFTHIRLFGPSATERGQIEDTTICPHTGHINLALPVSIFASMIFGSRWVNQGCATSKVWTEKPTRI